MNNLWSIPWRRPGRDCTDYKNGQSPVADTGRCLRCGIYLGRIHHHFLYDAYTWNQAEKMDLLFILLGSVFS